MIRRKARVGKLNNSVTITRISATDVCRCGIAISDTGLLTPSVFHPTFTFLITILPLNPKGITMDSGGLSRNAPLFQQDFQITKFSISGDISNDET